MVLLVRFVLNRRGNSRRASKEKEEEEEGGGCDWRAGAGRDGGCRNRGRLDSDSLIQTNFGGVVVLILSIFCPLQSEKKKKKKKKKAKEGEEDEWVYIFCVVV